MKKSNANSKQGQKKQNGITAENGALILTGSLPPGVKEEEIQKMLAEDMHRTVEDVVPRLPQIKILHAGACRFKMPPDEEDNEEVVDSFQGIIVDKHRCNAWWEKSFAESGGGVPPDCASLDGKRGIVLGGDFVDCATCPHNQFGTAVDDQGHTTRGKACKNMLRLHIWMEGHTLPRRLTLPPTSIKEADNFFSVLMDRAMPMTTLRVKFSLAEAKSSQGIAYSQIRFSVLNQIPTQLYYEIKKWLELHLAQIRGQEVLAEEYMPEAESESEKPESPLAKPDREFFG